MSLSVKEILNIGTRQLTESGIENPEGNAKALYCHLTGIPYARLVMEYQQILQDMLCDQYFALLDRRCTGMPLQYITGSQEFMGFPFAVDERVLIPRLDTEVLVEDAVEVLTKGTMRGQKIQCPKGSWEVLDLCTGSGCIGISLAKLCPGIKVVASDKSKGALEVAKKNAAANGVDGRVSFVAGDLFAPFQGFRKRKFQMIISNPPYVKTHVVAGLQKEIRDHEPMLALDGGLDGFDVYRRIVQEAPAHLTTDGILIMEIGEEQGHGLQRMLEGSGQFADIAVYQDLTGRNRVVMARRMSKKEVKEHGTDRD